MRVDCTLFCQECTKCASRGKGTYHLTRTVSTQMEDFERPFQQVAIDLLAVNKSKDGNDHLVVITDYLTRWAEAYPIKGAEAVTVVDTLMRQFIPRYGCPERIKTDQGPEFKARLFKEMGSWMDCQTISSIPYRPQSNGMVERFNRTLIDMLSMYCSANSADWDYWLPFVLFAYRTAFHEVIQHSPYEML